MIFSDLPNPMKLGFIDGLLSYHWQLSLPTSQVKSTTHSRILMPPNHRLQFPSEEWSLVKKQTTNKATITATTTKETNHTMAEEHRILLATFEHLASQMLSVLLKHIHCHAAWTLKAMRVVKCYREAIPKVLQRLQVKTTLFCFNLLINSLWKDESQQHIN